MPSRKLLVTLLALLFAARAGTAAAALTAAVTAPGAPEAGALSPDLGVIAGACGKDSLCLWDARTGRKTASAPVPAGGVSALAFSPDGTTLAAGCGDYAIRLFDAGLKRKALLRGHRGRVLALAFSANGGRLASGSSDTDARLWDALAGRELAKLSGHTGSVFAAAFLADGQRLATAGGSDRTVRLWDLRSAEAYAVLRGSVDAQALAVSPDGAMIAEGGARGGVVLLWDLRPATPTAAGAIAAGGAVKRLALSPDGRTLAAAMRDNSIRAWTLPSFEAQTPICPPGEVGPIAFQAGASGRAEPQELGAGRPASPLAGRCKDNLERGATGGESKPHPEFVLPEEHPSALAGATTDAGAPEFWLSRAEADLKSGGTAKAALALAKAAALAPGFEQSRRLAADYALAKEPRRALAILEPLTEHLPPDAGLWLEAAEAAKQAGDREKALSLLSRAREKALGAEDTARAARLYRGLGEPAAALELLMGLTSRGTADGSLWLDQADAAAKMDSKEASLAALAQARLTALTPAQRGRAAQIYIQDQDFASARGLLEELTRSLPGDAVLWLDLADCAAKSGDKAAALSALKSARALPLNHDQLARLVRQYRDLRENALALEALRALTQGAPADAGAWLDESEAALEAGDRALALESARRALALKPSPEARRRAAGLYLKLGEPARAADTLSALARGGTPDAALWLETAEADAKAGRASQASQALARARASSPGAEHLRRAAALYRELGLSDDARAALAELVGVTPEDAAARLEQAEAAVKAGDRATALPALAYARILEPKPDDLQRAAALYRDLGESRLELEALDELRRAAPGAEGPDLARRWARLYSEAGRHAEALDAWRRLTRDSPRDGELWLDLASEASNAGDRAGALSALARARELPLKPEELHRAALLYQDAKDYPRALAILEELSRQSPREAAFLRDRGLCLFLSGAPDAAVAALKEALALDGASLEGYATLASILVRQKRFDEALALYDRALGLPAGGGDPVRDSLVEGRAEALRLRGR